MKITSTGGLSTEEEDIEGKRIFNFISSHKIASAVFPSISCQHPTKRISNSNNKILILRFFVLCNVLRLSTGICLTFSCPSSILCIIWYCCSNNVNHLFYQRTSVFLCVLSTNPRVIDSFSSVKNIFKYTGEYVYGLLSAVLKLVGCPRKRYCQMHKNKPKTMKSIMWHSNSQLKCQLL